MDPSAGHYRQIELQSPEDFSYLINNVRRAAADSINAAFPPVEGGHDEEDDLRVRIEQLVNKYITRTFALAAPNISINGLPIDDPTPFLATSSTHQKPWQEQQQQHEQKEQEQYEPFDARKRARVEELAREEEDLLRDIAALKRRAPAAAAAAWAASQRAGLAADEAALEAARARVGDDGDDGNAVPPKQQQQQVLLLGGGGGGGGGDAAVARQEAVEQAYAGAVDTLDRLKRDMPATVARMERARLAGEYVVTER